MIVAAKFGGNAAHYNVRRAGLTLREDDARPAWAPRPRTTLLLGGPLDSTRTPATGEMSCAKSHMRDAANDCIYIFLQLKSDQPFQPFSQRPPLFCVGLAAISRWIT
jgi:hypothetical protein